MPRRDNVGEFGVHMADAGDSGSGVWYAVMMLEDTVFATLTGDITFASGDITDYTFPKGFILRCPVTAYEVTSGSCVLVRDKSG